MLSGGPEEEGKRAGPTYGRSLAKTVSNFLCPDDHSRGKPQRPKNHRTEQKDFCELSQLFLGPFLIVDMLKTSVEYVVEMIVVDPFMDVV